MFVKNNAIRFVSVLVVLTCFVFPISGQVTLASNISLKTPSLALTDSFPILINSNDGFEILGFPGHGTGAEPYLIENLHIVSTGSLGAAISISNTNVCFTIQNCVIESKYIGIIIQQTVAPVTAKIINNTITCSTTDGGGISVGASDSIIKDNIISGFMQGIHINEANHTWIEGNRILLSYYQGINIRYSSENLIFDNEIRNSNQHGLAIVGTTSSFNIIYRNTFVNNSNSPTYEIDGGVVTGETSSQAYDEGQFNLWQDSSNETGNTWDDYDGEGVYYIDGSAGSYDQFPQKYFITTTKTNAIVIVSIIPILGLITLIRRRNRRLSKP